MNNRLKIIVTLACLLAILGVGYIYLRDKNKNESVMTTTEIQGYEIRFEKGFLPKRPDTMIWSRVSILQDGAMVFNTEELDLFSGFYIDEPGDWIKNADDLVNGAIKDINGNGIPELILLGHSGGAGCCHDNYVIEFSSPISILMDLHTGNESINFKDLNNDGVFEIETNEDVFNYWNASHLASPSPRVVLSLQNGEYRADPSFMRQPAPADLEIRGIANAVKSWSGSAGPEVAWKYALDLIYSGNTASAKKYVDLAWRENDPGDFGTKENFWRELINQIHTSPYYIDLVAFFEI